MPPVVDLKKCTGCRSCFNHCPGDLFVFDKKRKIPELRYPDECWHCGTCRMDCPEEAIKIIFPMEMI